MTKDFATLMAQVIPALIVAVVIQARVNLIDRLGYLKERLSTLDSEDLDFGNRPTPRSRGIASHAVLVLNLFLIQVLNLLTLGIAEIYCLLGVLNVETPGWTVGLTVTSVVVSLAVLVGSPIVEFLGPGTIALKAFWQTKRVWRYAYLTWAALLLAILVSFVVSLVLLLG